MTLPHRILVVRTGAIGDVVNALCLAKAAASERGTAVELARVVHGLSAPPPRAALRPRASRRVAAAPHPPAHPGRGRRLRPTLAGGAHRRRHRGRGPRRTLELLP